MEDIKEKLYSLCLNFIEQRIHTAETALEQAREASNDDTKSSAGDKFETTREMMQQDISRNKRLLMDAQQNLVLLNSIKDMPLKDKVRNGNLVYTSEGIFYISISAGQLKLDNENVYAISAVSPIGNLLIGKEKGTSFDFNGKNYLIKEII
ncbi:3-oxoacyl-ACP synthase [Pedobacter gandavensis]|uniref:3-oxoacyl-ACP synthase n=1 Tax=Pedobacter TaxID=84567 RepID=UPI0021056E07|nr:MULTISPECIES: 3-oxoacyl-ACP synthase [Pedobacter]WGQ08893.1 3-oxoacyl-ACP synthase [Pedobacter gandavensis]